MHHPTSLSLSLEAERTGSQSNHTNINISEKVLADSHPLPGPPVGVLSFRMKSRVRSSSPLGIPPVEPLWPHLPDRRAGLPEKGTRRGPGCGHHSHPRSTLPAERLPMVWSQHGVKSAHLSRVWDQPPGTSLSPTRLCVLAAPGCSVPPA